MNPVSFSPQAFTHVFDGTFPGQLVYTNATMSIKSHMRSFDVVLEDGKTGKELGFVGSFDGLAMDENTEYSVTDIFDGTYNKATGDDERPFEYDPTLAKPGYYKVKIIGTNDAGKTFSQEAPVYFDNAAPNLTVNGPEVVEYKNGQSSVTITGSVYDKDTEEMQKLGMNVSQASSKVYYQDYINGGRPVAVPVNADGTFTATVPTNATNPRELNFYAVDAATNRTYKEGNDIFVTRDDLTYGYMKPEKRTAKMGETANATLMLNKTSDVKQVVYKFDHYTNVSTMNVTADPSVADKVNVTVTDTPDSPGATLNHATVTITTKDGVTPLSGDLKLADVAFKMTDIYDANASVYLANLNTTVTNSNNVTNAVVSGNPNIYFKDSNTSLLRGGNGAEAFLAPDGGPIGGLDYSALGIKVTATSSNGTVYNGIISGSVTTTYRIPNLPLTDDTFELKLDVPGHFTVHKNFTIGFHDENGNVTPQNVFLALNPAYAGDVNKDDVIDINDVLYLQTYWGTNKRAADINNDGVVDEKDLAYVEKNYLMQNPTINYAPTPKKKYKGETLETVKSELGIK
ncbi:hypothetical protein CN692_14585 [Bacillus sp. AFS002410]|uniref:dockerin type I domain-containing protein n=1 Tax=Bacillus sp. AFS002410 TaxID=2033481 RepID=UPI000BEFD6EB|nr:dockerin type I domain-containing protein [Bacillus sp. AFS002410]PEJ57114.1 hypothetical protein CN692_14585 [Bacillus sp. AFS002410]